MPRWQEAKLLATALLCCAWAVGSCNRRAVAPEERYREAVASLRAGDFDRANKDAELGERLKNIDAQLRCRFRLLRIEALLQGDNALAAEKLLAAPPETRSPEYDVRARIFRARRAIAKSDFQTASQLTEEAQQLAENLSRADLQSEADIQMGHILGRQRQYDGAEAIYKRAVAHAENANDPIRQASAMNNVGMVRMLRARCDEALEWFEKAEALWRGNGAEYWAALARGNTAVCYQQLGDFEKALEIRKESLGWQRPGTLKSNSLGEMGTLLLADDPEKAISYYREARDMARQFGARTVAARWAVNLTVALGAVGDWTGAERALAEAMQLQPEPRSRVYLELNSAAISLGLGHIQEARAKYEQILKDRADDNNAVFLAHSGLANVWTSAGDTQTAAKHFEAAISLIENAWSELNANEHKITFLASLIRFYQAYVDALMTQGEVVKALEVADRSRSRLLAERLSRNIAQPPTNYRRVAKESRSVWLCYWLAPKGSFLWMVKPDGIRGFPLPPGAELEHLVREYRGFVESAMRDPMATPNQAGRILYEKLIAPVAPFLEKNADVVIVPDGALHQLSFDTLPIYSGGDTPARYVVDDYTIAIAPSLGVYRGASALRTAIPGRAALIIGDPVSTGPAYPRLPHAPVEIANVRRRLSALSPRVIAREAARPDVWTTANPGKYSVIHIAAHAEANEKDPLLSAIILSPSPSTQGPRLFARDMIDVPLQAELVTLSACRSSGAKAYRGEGLVGFAWAFLQAGSHSVVAGLWDVADESTSMLMDRMYENIARRQPPPRALRAARLAVRNSAWSKPFYWGPFQCYIR